MTRADIEKEYKIEQGVIRTPGKFEGEPVFAPYFWEEMLNGCTDAQVGHVDLFEVSEQDRRQFPELGNAKTVSLTCDGNGFVYCLTHDEDINAMERTLEQEQSV